MGKRDRFLYPGVLLAPSGPVCSSFSDFRTQERQKGRLRTLTRPTEVEKGTLSESQLSGRRPTASPHRKL